MQRQQPGQCRAPSMPPTATTTTPLCALGRWSVEPATATHHHRPSSRHQSQSGFCLTRCRSLHLRPRAREVLPQKRVRLFVTTRRRKRRSQSSREVRSRRARRTRSGSLSSTGGWADDAASRTARVNDPGNLVGACQPCNGSKNALPLGEGSGQWWPSGWPSGVWWPFGGP